MVSDSELGYEWLIGKRQKADGDVFLFHEPSVSRSSEDTYALRKARKLGYDGEVRPTLYEAVKW